MYGILGNKGVVLMDGYIRNANREDADDLALIYSKSFKTAFKGIVSDELLDDKFSYNKLRGRLNKEITLGTPTNSIMAIDDIHVGMITYVVCKNEEFEGLQADILRIYLLPEYWGRSIGMQLMEWALNDIQTKGCKKAVLWVIEDNVRARKFYEKLGFVHEGETRIINVGIEVRDMKYVKYL